MASDFRSNCKLHAILSACLLLNQRAPCWQGLTSFHSHLLRHAEPVRLIALRSGDGNSLKVMCGKMSKRAHATGIRNAVTKSWSERHFIFEFEGGDLFYWKEQPTQEYVKSNQDQEHFKGTRVVLTRARLTTPSAGASARCADADVKMHVYQHCQLSHLRTIHWRAESALCLCWLLVDIIAWACQSATKHNQHVVGIHFSSCSWHRRS